MPTKTTYPKGEVPQRRAADFENNNNSRWRFSRTISLDSLIVLVVTVISGLVFLITMNAKIDQQGKEIEHIKETTGTAIANVQKSVERVEADQKERSTRLALDAAERATRLELAIKEQHALVQSMLVPRLQR